MMNEQDLIYLQLQKMDLISQRNIADQYSIY